MPPRPSHRRNLSEPVQLHGFDSQALHSLDEFEDLGFNNPEVWLFPTNTTLGIIVVSKSLYSRKLCDARCRVLIPSRSLNHSVFYVQTATLRRKSALTSVNGGIFPH